MCREMQSWSLDEFGYYFFEPIDGRHGMGGSGENTIHLHMVAYLDFTCRLDGTKVLSRNGCRSCQYLKRSAVPKFMGAQLQGTTN